MSVTGGTGVACVPVCAGGLHCARQGHGGDVCAWTVPHEYRHEVCACVYMFCLHVKSCECITLAFNLMG